MFISHVESGCMMLTIHQYQSVLVAAVFYICVINFTKIKNSSNIHAYSTFHSANQNFQVNLSGLILFVLISFIVMKHADSDF